MPARRPDIGLSERCVCGNEQESGRFVSYDLDPGGVGCRKLPRCG